MWVIPNCAASMEIPNLSGAHNFGIATDVHVVGIRLVNVVEQVGIVKTLNRLVLQQNACVGNPGLFIVAI